MTKLTSREYWESCWDKKQKVKRFPKKIITFDLISKFLPKNSKLKCIEIGCVPGRFMIAFNKLFGYQVTGIDYCDLKQTEINLKDAGVENVQLIKEDFNIFSPKQRYDVVSSFGFIEHFDDPAQQIEKMVKILNPGGYLVMDLPNLRYGQYLLHKLLDRPDVFEAHNLKIMDLKKIEQIMKKYNLKTLFLGYYKPFQYWHTNKNPIMKLINLPILAVSFAVDNIFDKLGWNLYLTNKYFSPYIMYIGKK
ncbi:MAG: class I SAM-dependent methyltransferase [Nanoarchaeota archaeon]|nr:class I SAM-dependent methyltransferase [Nanoarchaeota archaeon]